MKEMIYQEDRKIELLDKGTCFGYEYYILNLGTHPTAYVKIPEPHPLYEKKYHDIYSYFDVNGGLTYSDNYLRISDTEEIEGWFIGWDYAHYGDYFGGEKMFPKYHRIGGKRWTTEEIIEEAVGVCRKLYEMENKDDTRKMEL